MNAEQKVKANFASNFILLMMGRLVSNLGTAVFNFALGLYIMKVTGSATAFTMVISFAILPGIFVNILAGVYVDKHDKKKIMVVSDILAGIAVFAFLILFKAYSTSLLVFIAYVIVLNTIQAFFNMSINASVPNIVSEDKVAGVNSAFQGMGAVINITGPILGALLYNSISMETIFILNAASFILSGISEMFIIFNKKADNSDKQVSFIDNVKEVFKYLNTQEIIKFLLTIAVVLNLILNPLVILVLRFVNYKIIGVSGLQLSLIEAAWAMGAIFGAIFVSTRKSVNPILKKFFVLIAMQAFLILLWIFPNFSLFAGASKWTITIIYILLIFLYGMLNTIQNIPIITHFQLKIPEELRGRVFAVMFTALTISTPIGMWIFGFLLEKIHWAYIPLGSGLIVLLICLVKSRNKHFREFADRL